MTGITGIASVEDSRVGNWIGSKASHILKHRSRKSMSTVRHKELLHVDEALEIWAMAFSADTPLAHCTQTMMLVGLWTKRPNDRIWE